MSTTNTTTVILLPTLFGSSTSYLLAYCIPLLCFSIVLTFAGTFLTLDRTRTFVPRADAVEKVPGTLDLYDTKQKKFGWLFEGGAGGVAAGYSFGLHLSTFLALLITNESSSSPLSKASFLAVWLLPVIATTVLAARFRYAALGMIGLTGGAALSLALCMITHPALTSRIVLTALLAPLALMAVILTALIAPHRSHAPGLSTHTNVHALNTICRAFTSCIGAFGIVLSIALLSGRSSWVDPWSRLWIPNGVGWGGGVERGLDAVFCLLWVFGSASDWGLKRWMGEDPDEKWDSYLAHYTSNVHNAHDRAGNFQPLAPWPQRFANWVHRLFHKDKISSSNDLAILFPSDSMLRDTKKSFPPDAELNGTMPNPHAAVLSKPSPNSPQQPYGIDLPQLSRQPTVLQKPAKRKRARAKGGFKPIGGSGDTASRRRTAVQFQPVHGYSSSSDGGSDGDTDSDTDVEPLKTPADSPAKAHHQAGVVMHLANANTTQTSLSGTTLENEPRIQMPSNAAEDGHHTPDFEVDVAQEMQKIAGIRAGMVRSGTPVFLDSPQRTSTPLEYSDVEERDVTLSVLRQQSLKIERATPGWRPDFMRKGSRGRTPVRANSMPVGPPDPVPLPPGAVPATPSLINAFNRIAAAHEQARSVTNNVLAPTSPMQMPIPQLPAEGIPATGQVGWDAFWRDVSVKAMENQGQAQPPVTPSNPHS